MEDPEVVMLLTVLINILGHDNRGDNGCPFDGSIWREGSTGLPEHESDEVEKRGSLRE